MWDECNCAVVWALFGIAFLWYWNENWPFPVLWPLLSFPNVLAYWVQHFHSIIFQDLKQLNRNDELLITKFRLKWEKVGKTTRPFRYDLNQIPYDCRVEMRNRFMGSDLKSTWITMVGGSWHCIGGSDQNHPQEQETKSGKMVVWGGLQIVVKEEKLKAKEKRKDNIQ